MATNKRMLVAVDKSGASRRAVSYVADMVVEGFHPSKQAQLFTGDTVGVFWRRHFAPAHRQSRRVPPGLLGKNEWGVLDLASELHMPKNTLFAWMRCGWLRFRRLPGYRGRCICWADGSELERLRRLRDTRHGWWDTPLPAELTIPKTQPQN